MRGDQKVPFLAALMFSLCRSQTLLCTPVSVLVCSLVEGGAWEGGREERRKREVRK